MSSLTQDSNHSSDYFDDDPEFLKAINEVEIPGDVVVRPSNSVSTPPLAQAPRLDTAEHMESNQLLDDDQPPPPNQCALKRQRSPDDDLYADEDGMQYHSVLNAVDGRNGEEAGSYLDSHTYGAARFGGFGEYMTRKRAKLQVQNEEVAGEEDGTGQRSKIFNGLQIYVRPTLAYSA